MIALSFFLFLFFFFFYVSSTQKVRRAFRFYLYSCSVTSPANMVWRQKKTNYQIQKIPKTIGNSTGHSQTHRQDKKKFGNPFRPHGIPRSVGSFLWCHRCVGTFLSKWSTISRHFAVRFISVLQLRRGDMQESGDGVFGTLRSRSAVEAYSFPVDI